MSPRRCSAPALCAAALALTLAAMAHADVLDPQQIPKFVEPLVIPPVMPPVSVTPSLTTYRIAVRQFNQQVLPSGYPTTTVWGYGRSPDVLRGARMASTFNFPAFTVETRRDHRVRVWWINRLVDSSNHFLPHLLPVDQTMLWANPPGPRDQHGTDPAPYTGPVPIVAHLHGAHVDALSDGFPEAWFLPHAVNIPSGFYRTGSHYGSVLPAPPGVAIFQYRNDQRATTLWYHDHTLGLTRLNVYAGLAGFWIIRDTVEDALNLPGPAPKLGDLPGARYYEIPIVVQDRSFNDDGSLFYPNSRAYFDGDEFPGPYYPETDVPPIWNPEFFANTIVVNGRTWPFLEVEPRLYRFRFLNGCNSRFLILKFNQPLMFHQIGSEGGLLPGAPAVLDQLLMGPAERADVIVDFSSFTPSDEITLLNLGPDEPFGGLPVDPAAQADPQTTGQVMLFRVVPLTGAGNPGQIPAALPAIDLPGPADTVRDLTLNEEVSAFADVPIEADLGTSTHGALGWDEPLTETMTVGDIEVWRLINLTEDSHPIHLHLVQFHLLDRQAFDAEAYHAAQQQWLMGMGPEPNVTDFLLDAPLPPNSWETGFKDTVIANPGEVTRIIARFDLAGMYLWHCHILEHEDNEMMRPYLVVPASARDRDE